MRDLVRARLAVVRSLRHARQQLSTPRYAAAAIDLAGPVLWYCRAFTVTFCRSLSFAMPQD